MRNLIASVSLLALACAAQAQGVREGASQATGQGSGTEGPSVQTPAPQEQLSKNPNVLKPTVNPVRESASKPTQPAFVAQAEDGQWTMPAKNTAATRYGGLDEINRDNVKNLQVAATFSMGTNRGQEGAPLVVGDTLYVVSSVPNILYALDLTKPGFPLKWR